MCYVGERINSRAPVLREPCLRSSQTPLALTPARPFLLHPLTRQPVTMSNYHIYAFNNSNPQWDLSTSEEREAVERTTQVLRENSSAIEEEFRNDLDVYWVIM
jgi:hypothetical protein